MKALSTVSIILVALLAQATTSLGAVASVTFDNPQLGPNGAAGPYPDPSSFTVGGRVTYEWPCFIQTCIPYGVKWQMRTAKGTLLYDRRANVTNASLGDANWEDEVDELQYNDDDQGIGVLRAWPVDWTNTNMAALGAVTLHAIELKK
jgi:hypothetical protein